jgi:hypothetical protein
MTRQELRQMLDEALMLLGYTCAGEEKNEFRGICEFIYCGDKPDIKVVVKLVEFEANNAKKD